MARIKKPKKKRGLEKLSIRTRIRIIRVNMHLRPSIQFRKNLSLSFFRLTRANKNIVPKINKLEKKNREKKTCKSRAKAGTSLGLLIIPSCTNAWWREASLKTKLVDVQSSLEFEKTQLISRLRWRFMMLPFRWPLYCRRFFLLPLTFPLSSFLIRKIHNLASTGV